jgi:hypothetical protein
MQITDYISFMTKMKLLELKRLAPRVNIDGISVEFSTRYRNKLGVYNPTHRKFIHNLYWIEQHMDDPDFKKELDEHIAHEVAHVAFPNHGRFWFLICRALGGSGNTTYSNQKFLCKGKYVAECPICGDIFYKHTKPKGNYYCGKCVKRHKENATLIFEECN